MTITVTNPTQDTWAVVPSAHSAHNMPNLDPVAVFGHDFFAAQSAAQELTRRGYPCIADVVRL